MDLFEKLDVRKTALGQYIDVEGYYIYPSLEGPIGNRMQFQGREVLVWNVNNYLGLANHPEVREADTKATEKYGLAAPMGSRLMSGNSIKHIELEKQLADFVGREKAMLLNFGYQGIMSAIDAVLDRKDAVVYDKDCHACIMDGVRMHIGGRFAFEHNDMDSLEKSLIKAEAHVEKTGGGILVISEGVFGMRGHQGKIKQIVELKKKYNFRLMVDDAHGFGTLGETGAGVGEEQNVTNDIDIYFATFAKSMAGVGAFFAADKHIIDYLKYNTRSQIFAKSLPLPFVEGMIKRLELIKKHPEYKAQLWDVATKLQSGLKNAGFDIGDTDSAITPVYIKGGDVQATGITRDIREEFGIFCSVVVYPVVPKGMVLIRMIPTAAHTQEDIDYTIHAFSSVRERLEKGIYEKITM